MSVKRIVPPMGQPSMSDTANEPISKTPFWNMNVPPELHTRECPEFLQYALNNDKDRAMLSLRDADFRRQTWEEVRHIINENRLDAFRRVPSDLRRYKEYCDKLVKDYGTVMAFVMQERLKWSSLEPKGEPFSDPGM